MIAIVDDSRAIVTDGVVLLEEMLPSATITGFLWPQEAVEYAKANPIALAILDIELGTVSGLDLSHTLHEINPCTNILFLTAYTDYALDAWDTPASGFLLKPLTAQSIREQLQKLRYPFLPGGGRNMMNWSIIFYFSIISAALLLSAVGVWLTALLPGIDRWSKRFFLSYFVVFLLCCLSGLLEIILEQQGVPVELLYLAMQLECLLLSMPLLLLTVYLLHCGGKSPRSSPLLWAVLGFEGFFCVILVFHPLIGSVVSVTADGEFYRGSLYPVLLLPMVLIMLLNLVGALRRRRRLSHKVFLGFLVAVVPTTLSLIVQLFVDAFALTDISYVLSALSMYSFVLSDQIEQDLRREREIARQQREIARQQREIARQQREIARQQRENAEHQREIARQEREIARQRLSILVLQMRPHFIYNSLACIHSLIRHEPEKAQQVTADFTNYLRQNFNAVVSEQPIPFTAELKHTQTYLAVERAQHEQLLEVSFDTPFTRFRLPPLTLQPIAENAVKHGMNPYVGPLHVWIQTRREESATVITVEDNGPGFDPNDENTPHPSLDNIRMRLELMCEGTMEITPRENGGTVVRVWVPDKRAED